MLGPLVFIAVDVITIDRTGENFRLIYDVKGRFAVHRITPEEAKVCYVTTLYAVMFDIHCVSKKYTTQQ